jgi:hypothetical protein
MRQVKSGLNQDVETPSGVVWSVVSEPSHTMCLAPGVGDHDLPEHVHWATARRRPLRSADLRTPIAVTMLVGQTRPARYGHNYIAVVQQYERIVGMRSRKQGDTHAAGFRGRVSKV